MHGLQERGSDHKGKLRMQFEMCLEVSSQKPHTEVIWNSNDYSLWIVRTQTWRIVRTHPTLCQKPKQESNCDLTNTLLIHTIHLNYVIL